MPSALVGATVTVQNSSDLNGRSGVVNRRLSVDDLLALQNKIIQLQVCGGEMRERESVCVCVRRTMRVCVWDRTAFIRLNDNTTYIGHDTQTRHDTHSTA